MLIYQFPSSAIIATLFALKTCPNLKYRYPNLWFIRLANVSHGKAENLMLFYYLFSSRDFKKYMICSGKNAHIHL